MIVSRVFGRLCAIMVAASPLLSVTATAQTPSGPVETLKPGDFLWEPEIAPNGPVTIVISTATQRAYVYRNGVPIAVSTVSTGRAGHETPIGVFTILQKAVTHHSNRYNNAAMPFMQRLTWDGIALHAGPLPGYAASHGCIRLPSGFAERLYAITARGATVVITDEAAVPEIAPTADPLIAPEDRHAAPENYAWNPERSPTGPISLLVSGRDRRLVVLRNGREIGSARVLIDAPILATRAYVLQAIDPAGPHWLGLPLPGAPDPAAGETVDPDRSGSHIPAAFRAILLGVLQPGTTMLVTRDTLASSGTGQRLRVFDTQR
ncbi:L,D-transpeptidase [Sphingomonas sp. PAMC 26621]|uniref:L,D-transpeptidase n=1 Tax=Sphingomonas sp. PAMC 26621 TaxID=1112213 RepID=UPI001EE657C5|nr:L,D-transpeptidase [Sphingomonas sp. PAMC 26621]